MNSLKNIPVLIRRNSIISSNSIPDGSKAMTIRLGAVFLNKIIFKKALPTESSIFTAEAHAIDQALDIILKSKHKKFIIFTDSLSISISIGNKKKTFESTRLNVK